MSENSSSLIENTITFVKKELRSAEGGHDWFHVERVYKNALKIAAGEEKFAGKPIDKVVISLAALLHDIADYKFHDGDETIGPEKARNFLQNQQVAEEVIHHIVKIIENISFKGGNQKQKFHSEALDIVQDADRLDAMGAIGIARTFNYGGFKNRPIYDPEILPKLDMSPSEYKSSHAPTVNHFYEKLLLLKNRMNTQTGKRLAEKRHRFMELFLEQFFKEWNGE